MATFKVERNEADTGEYDVVMLCADGVWDWMGTFVNKKAAEAEIRSIKAETAATEGAERHYQAQYAHACGY